MAATGKDVPMDEGKHEAIADGPVPVPGEAGGPAPGSAREHFHNSLGGSPSAAEGESDEEIAEALDDGYLNKSYGDADGTPGGGGRGMTMEEIQGAVDQPTKGQALITGQIGLLIEDVAMNTAAQTPSTSKQVP